MTEISECVLTVSKLKTYFKSSRGLVKAVDDVSFHIDKGEVLALVGESGCGKSVTALSILGLIKTPPASIEGSIKFKDRELVGTNNYGYRFIRGNKISMIFQEPMSSFDPIFPIGKQLLEVVKTHMQLSEIQAKKKIIEMLKSVHIPEPEKRYNEYPHQMSGGMLQRIMIAMALITDPEVIIADEPTTALDVTIQAQVLNLMQELQRSYNGSMLFITHDLGIVNEIANRVHVMYAGKIVEKASVEELFLNPLHPYTIGLLTSRVKREHKGFELPYIKGQVPKPDQFSEGCRFHSRCQYSMPKCRALTPIDFQTTKDHTVACWLFDRSEENEDTLST